MSITHQDGNFRMTSQLTAARFYHPMRWLSGWKRIDRQGFVFVVATFLISRALLVLVSIAAVTLIPADAGREAVAAAPWHIWQHWDALHYLAIAEKGYLPAHVHGQGLTSPAFFPLYPLLINIVSLLTLGDTYIAALLISNLALFFACYQLYLLVQCDFSVRIARGTVVALLAFPTAFFGLVPYAESLFLALAIASFRGIRQHHWLAAGVWGMLAALTRQAGLILVLPFVWECVLDGTRRARNSTEAYEKKERMVRSAKCREIVREKTRDLSKKYFASFSSHLASSRVSVIISATFRGISVPSVFRPLTFALLIPCGTLLYGLWLWHAVGDPLAFLHAQAAWGRHWAFPLGAIWDGARYALSLPGPYFTFRAWLDLLAVVLMCAVAVVGWKYLPMTYQWYAIPLYLIFLSQPESGWVLISQSRFMLELFPLFIVLGAIVMRRKAYLVLYLLGAGALQLGLMAMFARGGWIT